MQSKLSWRLESFSLLLEKLYVFTSGSAVHPKLLAIPRELQRLSDTRWVCRFIALRNIMYWLPALKWLLQEIAQEHNDERSVEARGLLAQIDLEFIVRLVTLHSVWRNKTSLWYATGVDSWYCKSCRFSWSFSSDIKWIQAGIVFWLCLGWGVKHFWTMWCKHPPAKRKILSSKLGDYYVMTTVGQREL